MNGPTRIKGKKIKFTVDAVDYWCNMTKVELLNEEADSDVVTFCDAASGGGRQWYLDLTAVQSTDLASFWRACWDNAGTDVPFTFAPHGNEVPTAAQPHFIGTCTIGPKPGIGGEAGPTPYTFDTRFDVEGEPTLDDGI